MKLSMDNLKWNIEITFGYAPALINAGINFWHQDKALLQDYKNEELQLERIDVYINNKLTTHC